jgi:hypothetical protein
VGKPVVKIAFVIEDSWLREGHREPHDAWRWLW